MKAALMGLPIEVSRDGINAIGPAMAEGIGMTLLGRAVDRHFFFRSGAGRFDAQPPAPATAAA